MTVDQRPEAIAPSSLPLEAPADVRAALASMGRTEDLAFAPGLRRLAMTGFRRNLIYVFELDRDKRLSSGQVALTAFLEILSPSLSAPHGVVFLDEDTIIVANREGAATIFRLPPVGSGARFLALTPLRTLRGSWRHRIATPGSVSLRELGSDQVEVLICNNYRDTVTRHRLDRSRDYRVRSNDVLLNAGLSIPDGVTISHNGRWIAISNHNTHRILVFENGPELCSTTTPVGELLDVDCPHGLHFTDDDRALVVASAASPFLHVYRSDGPGEADWHGDHPPVASIRVMDDETFLKGRYNPEEGGPKGLSMSSELNLLAITSEHQPLAFFDLAAVLGRSLPSASHESRSDTQEKSEPGSAPGLALV